MADTATRRRQFAEDLRQKAQIRSDALVEAFARVPRERFLGPGPWHIGMHADDTKAQYRVSDTAEPTEVYCDAVIAIDPVRGLNNGEPSSLARWIDRLAIRPGEVVVHVGSGTGYYTALLADMVGSRGQIMAFEVDDELASVAERNLSEYSQVRLVAGSPTGLPTRGIDAIFVSCGVTHPARSWLDALTEGGRIMLPITAAAHGGSIGAGAMYLATKTGQHCRLEYVSRVGIFHCVGQRDEELNSQLCRIEEANWHQPRALRLDGHGKVPSCWLHAASCCLSTIAS